MLLILFNCSYGQNYKLEDFFLLKATNNKVKYYGVKGNYEIVRYFKIEQNHFNILESNPFSLNNIPKNSEIKFIVIIKAEQHAIKNNKLYILEHNWQQSFSELINKN